MKAPEMAIGAKNRAFDENNCQETEKRFPRPTTVANELQGANPEEQKSVGSTLLYSII